MMTSRSMAVLFVVLSSHSITKFSAAADVTSGPATSVESAIWESRFLNHVTGALPGEHAVPADPRNGVARVPAEIEDMMYAADTQVAGLGILDDLRERKRMGRDSDQPVWGQAGEVATGTLTPEEERRLAAGMATPMQKGPSLTTYIVGFAALLVFGSIMTGSRD